MRLLGQKENILQNGIFIEKLAVKYGTPFYLYDLDIVKEKIEIIRKSFGHDLDLFYAMKANPNHELIGGIREYVDGLDIASGGELEMAFKAGYDPAVISFAGPGKTKVELQRSIEAGIGFISVESNRELADIENLVRNGLQRPSIILRVNPKLSIKEFAVKMGGKSSQFGIDEEDLPIALRTVKQKSDVYDFKGIHIYSGTQCLSENDLLVNLANIMSIAAQVTTEHGMECKVINIGGGFGVNYYEQRQGLDIGKLADAFKKEFDRYRVQTKTNPRIILELGRFLVAEAGIYVARVVSEKESRGESFIVLDGGMNHHLAASGNLGSTIRKNYMVKNLSRADAPKKLCTLVGPLCTPMDLMGKGVYVETPEIGDLIGFFVSGSYGFTASPLFFLGHKHPKEIVISSGSL